MGSRYKGSKSEINALNTYIKLTRAAESISMRVSTTIPRKGLTESQFGVLEAIYHLGPMHQKELGNKLLKTGGNITLVVDNLEKQKYIRRERGVDDRRYIKVHLTKLGNSLIQKLFPQRLKAIVQEMKPLTETEQAQLQKLCKKIGIKDEENIKPVKKSKV